jgi:hypothetical protein
VLQEKFEMEAKTVTRNINELTEQIAKAQDETKEWEKKHAALGVALSEQVRISKWMYMYICIYIPAYIHTCIHTYIHTHTHTYTYTYIHTCMHAYIHVYVHVYT